MLRAKTPAHRRGTTTAPASCTARSIRRAFQGPASSATALRQRGIGFSVAEIIDPAKFKRSYGSSEKDADGELAAAAVAVDGHLVSSLSVAVYILGAILTISVNCEQL